MRGAWIWLYGHSRVKHRWQGCRKLRCLLLLRQMNSSVAMSIWMQVLFPVGPITLIKCHWQDEIWHQEIPQPPFSITPGLHYQAASSPGVGSGAQPIWPISREVRQPSPSLVLPTLSPFTKLLIAVHREMLAPFTTFTFLLGKCRTLLAQEQTFRLQKKSCVCLSLEEEQDRVWGSESECRPSLADSAQIHQMCSDQPCWDCELAAGFSWKWPKSLKMLNRKGGLDLCALKSWRVACGLLALLATSVQAARATDAGCMSSHISLPCYHCQSWQIEGGT